MLRWIVGWSLRYRLLVVVGAGALLFFGIRQTDDMPVDVLPEFKPPTVEIQTEALGLSAQEVEQLITSPFEQDLLNGVAFLDEIRSESIPGLSSIVLTFEEGTDIYRARQVVQERLSEAQVTLPGVSTPPRMLQPTSSTSRVMMIGLSSKELSLIDMSVLARWTIRPRLMGIPGVANVSIWGQRERQLQVQVEPERLRNLGVSLHQVVETTGNALWVSPLSFLEASTPGTGGFIDTPNQRLTIQHLLPIKTADDLSKVPIEQTNGRSIRLGDVASVVEDHQPLIGDALTKDGPGLLLVVEKFPEANTLAVTEGVEEALEELKPGLRGVEVDPTIFRRASYIEGAVVNLGKALLIGAVLLVLTLAIFSFALRTASLVSLIAILLSLISAGLVLFFTKTAINAMIVAGLVASLGVFIDDGIVDAENIKRRLSQLRKIDKQNSIGKVILEASLEVRGPLTYATLIILASVVPIFFMKGLVSPFFRSFAVSFSLATVVSMFVALIVTPAFSLLLWQWQRERRQLPLAKWLDRRYRQVLSVLISQPRSLYLLVAVFILVTLAVLPFVRGALIPSFRDSEILIQWRGAPGTSLSKMNRITNQVTSELRSISGVRNVGAHVGRAIMSDQVVNVNSGELWINVDPTANYDVTVASIEDAIEGYPGIGANLVTYPNKRINEEFGGTDSEIVVRVFGHDFGVLDSKANEIKEILSGIDGVASAHVKYQTQEPTLEVEVDLAAAQRFGIKPGDVRRAAATLLSGIQVGSLFEEQKIFEVVVWSPPYVRGSITSIRELLIDTPSGHVRLDDVADVRIMPNPTVIRHEAVSRSIDVEAKISGRNFNSIAGEVEDRLGEVEFPLEHHAQVLGDYKERQSDARALVGFIIAASIGIFLLLQAAFGSWRLATLALAVLPLSLVGGLLAIFIGGGTVSIGALFGFLGILAIAARGLVLVISHFQHLEKRQGESFGSRLVIRGSQERLAPILLTAVATGMVVLPFALFGNIPGLEIAHPAAIVILGGLVSSTLLNLLVVPVLYLRFGRASMFDTSTEEIFNEKQKKRRNK